jgi:hypothetical protein
MEILAWIVGFLAFGGIVSYLCDNIAAILAEIITRKPPED